MQRVTVADLKKFLDELKVEDGELSQHEIWVGTPGGACAPCIKIVKMDIGKKGHGLMLKLDEPWRLKINKD